MVHTIGGQFRRFSEVSMKKIKELSFCQWRAKTPGRTCEATEYIFEYLTANSGRANKAANPEARPALLQKKLIRSETMTTDSV